MKPGQEKQQTANGPYPRLAAVCLTNTLSLWTGEENENSPHFDRMLRIQFVVFVDKSVIFLRFGFKGNTY